MRSGWGYAPGFGSQGSDETEIIMMKDCLLFLFAALAFLPPILPATSGTQSYDTDSTRRPQGTARAGARAYALGKSALRICSLADWMDTAAGS